MQKKILLMMCLLFVEAKIIAAEGPIVRNKTGSVKYLFPVKYGNKTPRSGTAITPGNHFTIELRDQYGSIELNGFWVSNNAKHKGKVGVRFDQEIVRYFPEKLAKAEFWIIPVDSKKPTGDFMIFDKSKETVLKVRKPEVSATAGSGSEGDTKETQSAGSSSTCH